jgi:hypothetical protein
MWTPLWYWSNIRNKTYRGSLQVVSHGTFYFEWPHNSYHISLLRLYSDKTTKSMAKLCSEVHLQQTESTFHNRKHSMNSDVTVNKASFALLEIWSVLSGIRIINIRTRMWELITFVLAFISVHLWNMPSTHKHSHKSLRTNHVHSFI